MSPDRVPGWATPTTAEAEWELPRDMFAPQIARARVRSFCAELLPQTVESAVLLASELATNAVSHGRGRIGLRLTRVGAQLRVEVSDELVDVDLEASAPPLLAVGGRGLMLVDRLDGSWGVTRSDRSKTVWFCLP